MTKPRSVAATANDNSIPGSRLEDSSITQDKFAPGITFDVPDGSITDDKVSGVFSEAIAATKLSYVASGGLARDVSSKLGETVSVTDFGAVGDGVTDDRAAIQAAIDHVSIRGGGTIYFPPALNYYSIRSQHPEYPGHALVVLPGGGTGAITFLGNGIESEIQLNLSTPITSLMYWPERLNWVVIRKMWINANLRANNVLKADETYHAYLVFENSDFRRATQECISLCVFVATFSRVGTWRGTVGFSLKGLDGGPATSLVLNSCYALQASQYGYDFGFLTYCTLNSCACDGNSSYPTQIGYNFTSAYSVTMNACGTEGVQRFLKVLGYRGFVVNTAYMLSAGSRTETPVDYLFEFVGGTNATVSGLTISSVVSGGYVYVLGQTGSSYGSENITVLDRCVSRNSIYQVSNFAFERPIKLLRGDQTEKSETRTFTDAATLRSAISLLNQFDINHTITWQLSDGTYDLTPGNPNIRNIGGYGVLIIQGNPTDNSAVKLLSNFNDLAIRNCAIRVVLKDLTIGGNVSNNFNYRLGISNSPNVVLDNVRILRDGLNVGYAAIVSDSSKLTLTNGSYAVGPFATTTYSVDDSSELIIEKGSAPPAVGTWDVGNVVLSDAPAAGGHVGWICTTAGTPGVWKTYGSISA